MSQLQQPCSQETTREKQCLATSKECCPAQSFALVLLYDLFGIHCPNLPSVPRTGTCMITFTFLLFCFCFFFFFLLLSGAAFLPQGDQKVVQVVTCAERSKESRGSSALISRCTSPSPGKLHSPNSLPIYSRQDGAEEARCAEAPKIPCVKSDIMLEPMSLKSSGALGHSRMREAFQCL